jgi:hypothetical protein
VAVKRKAAPIDCLAWSSGSDAARSPSPLLSTNTIHPCCHVPAAVHVFPSADLHITTRTRRFIASPRVSMSEEKKSLDADDTRKEFTTLFIDGMPTDRSVALTAKVASNSVSVKPLKGRRMEFAIRPI